MPSNQTLARSFKALAHPRRWLLFRLLATQPELGASTQTLRQASAMPETSFTHHIREMERAGLIRKRRKGPHVALALTSTDLGHALDMADHLLKPRRLRKNAA